MVVFRLLWRVIRRRWVRRVLFWIIVRLLRLFGWRRVVRLLFRGRWRWRAIASGLWRVAVGLLRMARSLLMLGGARTRSSRPLGHRTRAGLRSGVGPRRRRLESGGTPRARQLRRRLRTRLAPELARRRDDLRRAVLASVGVDPDWQPPSRRALRDPSAVGRGTRPELGDST